MKEHRWLALGAITIAVIAVGLDATVLNLALPTLAVDLHASSEELQWFVAAYTLVLAAAMLPAGILGDRYGRKRLLLASLAVVGAGSIACAYSTTPGQLIAARIALGVGAAFLITLVLSVITVLFSAEERPRAIAVWAAANFLAMPIGPLLGGWILANYWWGWVFLINAPVVALALAAVFVLVPESRSEVRPALDPFGALLSMSGLATLTYGLIQAGEDGWTAQRTLVFLALGLALLVGLVVWERRMARNGGQPLIALDLFASRAFTAGTILAGIGILALFGAFFAIPQYYQAVLGFDAQAAGLRLLPIIVGIVVGAGVADRIAALVGAKLTVAFGFMLLGAGALVGSTTSLGTDERFTVGWVLLCGAGTGMGLATAASAALAEIDEARAGIASALMQTIQKMGGPLGVAILGSVLNSAYRDALPISGLPVPAAAAAQKSVFAGLAMARQLGSEALLDSVRAAFVSGMDAMLVGSAVVAAAGVILALAFMPSGRLAATKDKSTELAA